MGERYYVADKVTLDKIYDILAPDAVYGFIEHMAILEPEQRIEYIGVNKYYTPMQRNHASGEMNLGDWAEFPWLKANKPYMVRSDGTPDYRLDENDYTKKLDGTASDVSNAAYDGGAFAWAQKIYKYEQTIGTERKVLFSTVPRDGFEPIGFKNVANEVKEGVWIPMFYGAINAAGKMTSLSGTAPAMSKTLDQQKDAVLASSPNAVFFGGPIIETLVDLMIMFSKTSHLKEAFGYGNCNGHDSADDNKGMKINAVVGGGQFFGTDDRKSLNKIFHSVVLGTYQQYQRDPYVVIDKGRVKVSKNYTYDPTGAAYTDTGINVSNGLGSWEYPDKFKTVPGYGSIPIEPYNGTSETGGCCGLYRTIAHDTSVCVSLNFANCYGNNACSPRTKGWFVSANGTSWDYGASVMFLPPTGVSA